jgi:hypothetical protein
MYNYRVHFFPIFSSVADPGCLYRILNFLSRIQGKKDPRSASENLSIFNHNNVSKLLEKLSGMFIPDPDFCSIPDTGSRGLKSSGSRNRNTVFFLFTIVEQYMTRYNIIDKLEKIRTLLRYISFGTVV